MRPGWTFPRNKAPLPPLDLEEDTVDKMATFDVDHQPPVPNELEHGVPERTAFVRGNVFSPPVVDEACPFNDDRVKSWKGHRRTASEIFSGDLHSPALNTEVAGAAFEQDHPDDPVFG
jgi:hypothetical protein